MANITRWRRPSSLSLRRDMEDILDEFDLPRGFRREIDRLFDEDLTPRSLWAEMDRVFDDFVSPPTLRRRAPRWLTLPSHRSSPTPSWSSSRRPTRWEAVCSSTPRASPIPGPRSLGGWTERALWADNHENSMPMLLPTNRCRQGF